VPEKVPPQAPSQVRPISVEYEDPSDLIWQRSTRFRREEIWKGPRRAAE